MIVLNKYDVLIAPIVTEKSTDLQKHNVFVFEVNSFATKVSVKKAIETIFAVKVERVNVINLKGKRKFFRGIKGKRPDMKKALVKVAEGQTIDINIGA